MGDCTYYYLNLIFRACTSLKLKFSASIFSCSRSSGINNSIRCSNYSCSSGSSSNKKKVAVAAEEVAIVTAAVKTAVAVAATVPKAIFLKIFCRLQNVILQKQTYGRRLHLLPSAKVICYITFKLIEFEI